jgi:hypothetical protein
MYSSFDNNIQECAERGNNRSAHLLIAKELGNVLANDKQSFVDLLVGSGIDATINYSPEHLVDLYVSNILSNQQLALGSSILAQMQNAPLNFDGKKQLNNESVKAGYYAIRDYVLQGNAEEEAYDNFGGAIAGAIGSVSDLAKTGLESRQKKKFGAMDALQKKQETKSQIVTAYMQQKQAELQAQKEKEAQENKVKKTIIIATSVVVGLGILGVIIYKIRNK